MFHHLTILNEDATENQSEPIVQDIGGPLCFQGLNLCLNISDDLFRWLHCQRGKFTKNQSKRLYCNARYWWIHTCSLLQVKSNWLANSNDFRYNSIQSPAVYAYSKTDNGFDFYLFKQRESYEAVSAFWGEKEPSKIWMDNWMTI